MAVLQVVQYLMMLSQLQAQCWWFTAQIPQSEDQAFKPPG
ncbi:hypothetical protein imdm_1037 [gamma proteobacterium IMCC2047]|nr:hypothetical protein imdm_1037 [gamma proteobacterium IMCC2047]